MNEQKVKLETIGETAMTAQIEISASPEKVYGAWTDPEQFVRWFGPSAENALRLNQFDCQVDGQYDLTMTFPDGDQVGLVGEYQELTPPTKIVFTWSWLEGSTKSNETLVTVDLSPSPTGTLLTLTHERFLTASSVTDHRDGRSSTLFRLASTLTA